MGSKVVTVGGGEGGGISGKQKREVHFKKWGVGRWDGGARRALLSAVVFVWSPFKDRTNRFTMPSPWRREAGFTACCPAPLPPSIP